MGKQVLKSDCEKPTGRKCKKRVGDLTLEELIVLFEAKDRAAKGSIISMLRGRRGSKNS